MNRLIEWWARNTVAANLLMLGIFLAGIMGFMGMEREIEPNVRFPGLKISVTWAGASPKDVEQQIVARIEESVRDLDGMDWIRSYSGEGFGDVFILAKQHTDFTTFMNTVKNRVDSITSLPTDIERPQVHQWVNRDEFMRIAVYGDLNEKELKRLAEVLRREAAQLPAVNIVDLFGVRREEISIEVSEDSLRRYSLTFTDVAKAIRQSSLNTTGGTIRTDAGSFSMAIRNQANTEKDFGEFIIRQTGDGATIRVRDVATIIDGFVDEEILATLNGKPAVLLQVMTTDTMDIVKASASVKEWIEKRTKTLPKGVELTLWTDQAEAFNGRMTTIGSAAIQGLFLVLVVLMLTLRPKVAFWVASGIATAYAGAFILLPYLDISINMLSTFAFLLVLGIVVDDAIVVGESIHTESQKTGGGITAAVFGTQLVAKPVVFAVLTTIIAFIPWILLEGGTSEFTRHITWVVVTALSFSLVESLLILPAHLSNLKPRKTLGRFGHFQKRIATSITNFAQQRYRGMGKWAVTNRYLTFSIFAFIFVFSIGLFSAGYVKKDFMPDIESDQIIVDVEMPEGSPYSRALEVLEQLQIAEKKLVTEAEAKSGKKHQLIENWYTRSRRDNVMAIVKLAPPEVRTMSTKDVSLRLRELIGEIPDAKKVSVQYTNRENDPGFELSIRHDDLAMLREAVADLEDKLRTYDSLYDVRNNMEAASDEIRLTLKPGVEKLGLTLADVSRQVRQAYFGEEAQRLARGGQDVKVMVRYPLASRRSIESLKDFRVRTAEGNEVPLVSIADLEFAPGIKGISHWNMARAARVSAEMKESVRNEIMKDLKENFFPEWEQRYPGLERGLIGQAQGEQEFVQDVMRLYSIAFFAMYMLLAIAFKSYSQPIAILIAIPFAFAGAVYGHIAADLTMAIFSYFGIAAAAGVVVNDNLVLVDCCNRLREQGLNAKEAIVEAGVARFRPILLTSVTTFIGLAPMMLEKSIQAAFLKPIVIALASGVFIAFFVTLLMVPALYAIGDDIVQGRRMLWTMIKQWLGLQSKVEKAPAQAE